MTGRRRSDASGPADATLSPCSPQPSKTQRVIEERTYVRDVLPRELEVQVLAFTRIIWPDVFQGEDRFRTCLWPDEHALHFVRTQR